VLLISQASSQNDLCLVISSAIGKCTAEALRHEFTYELTHDSTEHIAVDANVAMVTIVGQNMRSIPGIVGRIFGVLGRENINLIAIAHGSSVCTVSFVVTKKDMPAAITAIHREFRLGAPADRAPSNHTFADEDCFQPGQPAQNSDGLDREQ
jgi:bifunctional aspartokinase / homoserine dehydrogenase 1